MPGDCDLHAAYQKDGIQWAEFTRIGTLRKSRWMIRRPAAWLYLTLNFAEDGPTEVTSQIQDAVRIAKMRISAAVRKAERADLVD